MSLKLTSLLRSEGLRQSFWLTAGNLFATGLSAVALILISRLLGPEKFGIFSVGFALVLILTRLNEAGLNTPILKFAPATSNWTTKNQIFSMILKWKLLISGGLMLVGLLFTNQLTAWLNFPEPTLLVVAFTWGLATTYYEYLLSVLQSLHRFAQTVFVLVIPSVVKLLAAVVLFFLSESIVLPIFTIYVLAPIAPVLFARWLLPRDWRLNLSANNPALRQKILKLTQHSAVALIAAGIIENIDVLFLQKYLTSYDAGLYAGVSRISLLFALMAYSLGNVLFPRVARYKTRAHLQAYLSKAWLVVLLTVVGFLAFLPFAQLAINWTIGPEYLSGWPILIILSAASFLAIAATPFMALFYSLDADWYFSVSGLGQLAIVLVGNFVLVPLYGLEAAAWTRFAARVFLMLFSLILGLWLYRRKYVVPSK